LFSIPRLIAGTALLLPMLLAGPVLAAGTGYHPNGKLQWEYLYQDEQVREAKWYDEQGQLQARTVFRDGLRVMSEGYRSDGSLEWQIRYLGEGRQEITRFSPTRQTEMRYDIVDGQTDGPSTVFYPNGQPRQIVTFRNGTPDGPARTYYENGRIESTYAYGSGQLNGSYQLFSPEGQLCQRQVALDHHNRIRAGSAAPLPADRHRFAADPPVVGLDFVDHHHRGGRVFPQHLAQKLRHAIDQLRLLCGGRPFPGNLDVDVRHRLLASLYR
jgi:antitoxin component YwqK of YwqJK toxin-antitoxin module